MDASAEYYFDEEQEDNRVHLGRLRRRIRDSSNPFELPDAKFIYYFHINKDGMQYLVITMSPYFKTATRISAVPPLLKVFASLRFLDTGSYQTCGGIDFNIGLAQPTFSVVLDEFLTICESELAEMQESNIAVFEKTGFPGVIGFVDSTHVRINSPPKEEQHLFLNRKGYYSLNVMIFCDNKLQIRYVDARYPGSNHDSHVWNLSTLKDHLDRSLPNNTWILGDSGYPLQKNLITPFRSISEGSPQAKFIKVHCKARNTVERTIGVLKARLRCLLSVRGLHYSSKKSCKIVNMCCIMHNICKHFKTTDDEIEIEEQPTIKEEVNNDNREAKNIRNEIMRSIISTVE